MASEKKKVLKCECDDSLPYVFISYSHNDSEIVLDIISELKKQNLNIWFDEGIDPGTEWDENIANHIDKCSFFIAMMSQNSVASQNCKDEINYARELEKERLLVYLDDVELQGGMKMRLSRIQAIYYCNYSDKKDFYEKLKDTKNLFDCKKSESKPGSIVNASDAQKSYNTMVCLGKDINGESVLYDIARMPHALIGGVSGTGKTNLLNNIIMSIISQTSPDEVRFLLIDGKGTDFSQFSMMPHLILPVLAKVDQALSALDFVEKTLADRFNLLIAANCRTIDEYNSEKVDDKKLFPPMAKLIIIIDEFAELMLQGRAAFERFIFSIISKGRSVGIHLLISTQRSTPDVVSGVLKSNMPTRIAFHTSNRFDSQALIGQTGAEELAPLGDMLIKTIDNTSLIHVQGGKITKGEIAEGIISAIKKYGCAIFDDVLLLKIKNARTDFDRFSEETKVLLSDDAFIDAVECVLREGSVSIAFIQRKMLVGYSRACRCLDAMEEIGIVSNHAEKGRHSVIMSKPDWTAFVNKYL